MRCSRDAGSNCCRMDSLQVHRAHRRTRRTGTPPLGGNRSRLPWLGWNRGRRGGNRNLGSYHTQRDSGTQGYGPAFCGSAAKTWRRSPSEGRGAAGVDRRAGKFGRACGPRRPDVAAALDLQEHTNPGWRVETSRLPGQPDEGRRAFEEEGLQFAGQSQDAGRQTAHGSKRPV